MFPKAVIEDAISEAFSHGIQNKFSNLDKKGIKTEESFTKPVSNQ
jgi:hypothetical protein